MAATLQLKSITCLQQQEVFTDELYLTFNGRKISCNYSAGQAGHQG